jgi:hypothetical protein
VCTFRLQEVPRQPVAFTGHLQKQKPLPAGPVENTGPVKKPPGRGEGRLVDEWMLLPGFYEQENDQRNLNQLGNVAKRGRGLA